MKDRGPQEVAHAVQKALRTAEGRSGCPESSAIRVIAQGVQRKRDPVFDAEWWLVPVEISTVQPKMYLFYEMLSNAEQYLEDEEALDVLLVPRVPEEQAA